jgi:ubiquinone/menaquinone biosynthesis C-methylase UbiE
LPINKKRIEESYDLQAENYKGAKQIAYLLIRDLQIPKNSVCLDIGCGDGLTTAALYEHCQKEGIIYGLDISQRMIDKAIINCRKLGYEDICFLKGDAESLNFPANMFDVVVSLYTFQFIPDKWKCLKEMYRVLKPGGYMCLFFPASEMFQKETFEIFRTVTQRHVEFTELNHVISEFGEMHITLEEFQDMLHDIGFTSLDFMGRHRVIYEKNMKNYLETNPYPFDLLLSIPDEYREKVKTNVIDKMLKLSDKRGFKLTFYNIMGHAQKPNI